MYTGFSKAALRHVADRRRMERVAMLATLAFVGACGSKIHDLYEQTRDAALTDPGPVPENWTPDATLSLSWDVLRDLLDTELAKRVEKAERTGITVALPLGAEAKLYPELDLVQTEIDSARSCATCVKLGSAFSGEVRATVMGLETRVPVDVEVETVVEMISSQQDDKMVIDTAVHSITVDLARSLQIPRIKADLDNEIVSWVRDRLQQDFPTIRVAELGSADTPIRALRLSSSADSLQVQVLTQALTPASVSAPTLQGSGWALAIKQSSILELARKSAFEAGPMDYDVVPEPTGLDIQGNAFTLGLRVWRLSGNGWWRDYSVTGDLVMNGSNIKVKPDHVEELEASAGAGLADPLAMLASGQITKAIENAASIARPASMSQEIDGTPITMEIQSIMGRAGVLEVRGSASTAQIQRKSTRGHR